MKKIAVILLTLVLTLAMTVPVMAENTEVGLEIEEPYINLSTPNIALGSLLRGEGGTLGPVSGTVSVQSNAPLGYTVIMTRDGNMGGLTNNFEAWTPDSGWTNSGGTHNFSNTSAPTPGEPASWDEFTLLVKQLIDTTDPTGSYSTTITFAGTVK